MLNMTYFKTRKVKKNKQKNNILCLNIPRPIDSPKNCYRENQLTRLADSFLNEPV